MVGGKKEQGTGTGKAIEGRRQCYVMEQKAVAVPPPSCPVPLQSRGEEVSCVPCPKNEMIIMNASFPDLQIPDPPMSGSMNQPTNQKGKKIRTKMKIKIKIKDKNVQPKFVGLGRGKGSTKLVLFMRVAVQPGKVLPFSSFY